LAVTCATSDSICEKSGLIAASTTVLGLGSHLTSSPASASTLPDSSGLPSPFSGRESWLPLA
jgi:hypothetical protein